MTNKYWTRKQINFGFGIQTFGTSLFGASKGHGDNYSFGEFQFSKVPFGSPNGKRFSKYGPGKILNHQGHKGRISNLVLTAKGTLAGEEYYSIKGNINFCKAKGTKIIGHYHNLKKAKINSLVSYIYYQWNKLSQKEKDKYNKSAEGKNLSGINIYFKDFFDHWGFGKGKFGKEKFASYHFPIHYYGFSTVAFGMGAFGTPYPTPRRNTFGNQPFGEMRFGGNIRGDRKIREF